MQYDYYMRRVYLRTFRNDYLTIALAFVFPLASCIFEQILFVHTLFGAFGFLTSGIEMISFLIE